MKNEIDAAKTPTHRRIPTPRRPRGERHPLERLPDRLAARTAQHQQANQLMWLRLSQSMFAGPSEVTRVPTVCGSPAPMRIRARRLRPDL